MTQAANPPSAPVLIGAYAIDHVLAAGPAATVCLARDGESRSVAIKMSNAGSSPDARRRFLDVAAATWDHPGPSTVRVLDVSEQDGRPYVVLEYADGGSLDDWANVTELRPPSPVEALAVMRGIAACLVDLHDRGVAHRNLKPSNVLRRMKPDGSIGFALTDLRPARSHSDPEADANGLLFRPLEPADGEPDRRGDVYAAAAIACWVLLGPSGVPRRSGRVARPSQVRAGADIPDALDVALLAALAPDPEARPTARQWCAMLGVAARDLEAAQDSPAPETGSTPVQRAGGTPAAASDDARGPAPRAEPTMPTPSAEPPLRIAPPAVRATHRVPAAMPYWTRPDPGSPPAGMLAPGTDLAVAEYLGAWARVVASNGWTAWVDGRLLQALPGA
jgi:hypothetical protein